LPEDVPRPINAFRKPPSGLVLQGPLVLFSVFYYVHDSGFSQISLMWKRFGVPVCIHLTNIFLCNYGFRL
jgi:hypothetical protein